MLAQVICKGGKRELSNTRDYRHWSTSEEQRLYELRKQGLKFREIGEKLERTAISVEKRYRKLMNSVKVH